MKKIFKDYGLSIVLTTLFLVSWIAQFYFQWIQYVQTQEEHNQPIEMSSYMPEFLAATFENWQSEFLQLLSFVVLTSFLIHKGSGESKDSTDQMQASLARIEKALKKKK